MTRANSSPRHTGSSVNSGGRSPEGTRSGIRPPSNLVRGTSGPARDRLVAAMHDTRRHGTAKLTELLAFLRLRLPANGLEPLEPEVGDRLVDQQLDGCEWLALVWADEQV